MERGGGLVLSAGTRAWGRGVGVLLFGLLPGQREGAFSSPEGCALSFHQRWGIRVGVAGGSLMVGFVFVHGVVLRTRYLILRCSVCVQGQ